MKSYTPDKIRNVALTGHGGSGKTSLAEALLYMTGATDRLGKVSDGNTVCDFDQEETKRKISVSSAAAPFEYEGGKVNLLDTPGLFDFAAGFYEGARAADSLLIVLSGRSGLTVGAEKAFKMANDLKKSKMVYISKMDTENADFYKVLEDLKAAYGPSVCPIVVPYVEDHKVVCYINVIDMKAYTYDNKGKASEIPMPDVGHRLDGLMEAISEAVAETDEELFEKFFSGEQFTREEIIKGINKGVKDGIITPVYCGSSTTLAGVDMLLEGICHLLPCAADKASEVGTKGDELVEVNCTPDEPMAAYVFKTVADPFIGKLSYVKVISGRLTPDMAPVNARTGNPERLGKLIIPRGKKQEDCDGIGAGDIGAITKLNETITGDTLCDPKRVVSLEPIRFPIPCLSMAIKPRSKGDEGKISQSITRLCEEDSTISYEMNTETKQQVISGLGEQHLDVIVSKLKSKFGVDVDLEEPIVPYRETIRKKVKVNGRHKKQTGGHGQFGDVWIEFEPCVGDDLVFEERVFGGAVPKGFFPAVEKGLRDCIKHGPMAGYPVVGLKATLVDGSYHPVDSSEMSFKMAATLAYKAGMPQASPCILEPIGSLHAYVPDANTGDLIGELNKRRGRVLGMNPTEDKLQEIEAEVPMSEMHDFATALRSMTQGRGWFTLEFVRYEQLPQMLEGEVILKAKKLFDDDQA